MPNTITPKEVHEHLSCGNCLLIDVREADERASEAIDGSLHLPLGRIKAGEFPPTGRQVILHCKSGRRSAAAPRSPPPRPPPPSPQLPLCHKYLLMRLLQLPVNSFLFKHVLQN
jgi:hypothetical protein